MRTRKRGSRWRGRQGYMRITGKLLLRKLLLLKSRKGDVVVYVGGEVGPGSLVRRKGPMIMLECQQARIKRATGKRGSDWYRQLRMLLVKSAFLVTAKNPKEKRSALDVQTRERNISVFFK